MMYKAAKEHMKDLAKRLAKDNNRPTDISVESLILFSQLYKTCPVKIVKTPKNDGSPKTVGSRPEKIKKVIEIYT